MSRGEVRVAAAARGSGLGGITVRDGGHLLTVDGVGASGDVQRLGDLGLQR